MAASAPSVASVVQGCEEFWLATSPVQPDTSVMADFTGLRDFYKAIRDYGVVDIGLQAALDVGVSEQNYICIPRSCVKPVVSEIRTEVVTNIVSGKRIRAPVPIILSSRGRIVDASYNGVGMRVANNTELTADELKRLVVVNLRSTTAAGFEGAERDLIVATHVMAFLMGAVDTGGEAKLVNDPADIQPDEEEFAANFPAN